MKTAVTGYITAVINNYTRTIDRMRKLKVDNISIRKYEVIREELNDLLDFVDDIPEESSKTEDKKDSEIKYYRNKIQKMMEDLNELTKDKWDLQKRVNELEESCKQMCEVERNQLKKIELLEADNHRLNIICKQYMQGGNE